MKKSNPCKKQEETFDIAKWRAQYAGKFTIMPKEYFPDVSNHPFFKRKLEKALEFAAKNP